MICKRTKRTVNDAGVSEVAVSDVHREDRARSRSVCVSPCAILQELNEHRIEQDLDQLRRKQTAGLATRAE